ncbi:MAG: TolC family protein [Gemmatimonadota bacterium]
MSGSRKIAARGAAAALGVLVFAAGGGVAQTPVPTPAPAVMTLEEVVQRTLQNSPQIVQAQGAVQTAGSAERSALGTYLPSLSFSSGASLASSERFDPNLGTTVSGSSDSYSAGMSSSIDIFTGGRRGAQMAQARAQTDVSEASLTEQRYTVTRTAKAAFFDVLRATDVIRSAEARVRRAQEALDAAELRQQAGSATRSDQLRARLEVSNARQALLQAENQKRTAMYALGRLVAADGPVDARADAPFEVRDLPLSRESIVELAVSQSPTVVTAVANERSAGYGVRSARAQYLPSLSGSGSYNWSNTDPSFNNVRGSWSTRLSLSYPVFNRFAREEQVDRARVQERVAEYQLQDVQRAARANVERVLGSLETARLQIELAQESLAMAEEDLRVQQERYRLGVATILEQVSSQESLVSAENALISARYDYQLALAELEALIGREL